MNIWFCFFFFSSRRRHTRWNCDWSSDVCSSDLMLGRDGREVEAQDFIRLEEYRETFDVGDRPIDRAALKPADRGREVQIVGERATERFEPPLVQGGTGGLALGQLRPVANALTKMVERFGRLP